MEKIKGFYKLAPFKDEAEARSFIDDCINEVDSSGFLDCVTFNGLTDVTDFRTNHRQRDNGLDEPYGWTKRDLVKHPPYIEEQDNKARTIAIIFPPSRSRSSMADPDPDEKFEELTNIVNVKIEQIDKSIENVCHLIEDDENCDYSMLKYNSDRTFSQIRIDNMPISKLKEAIADPTYILVDVTVLRRVRDES